MKRLYCSKNEIIAGVCGGLGEYFNIDPTWIRLAFFMSAVAYGFGVLPYVILWIIMSEK